MRLCVAGAYQLCIMDMPRCFCYENYKVDSAAVCYYYYSRDKTTAAAISLYAVSMERYETVKKKNGAEFFPLLSGFFLRCEKRLTNVREQKTKLRIAQRSISTDNILMMERSLQKDRDAIIVSSSFIFFFEDSRTIFSL